MKKIFTLLAALIMLYGCYDDSELIGRVDNLENRVSKLEKLCNEMNSNISSLQTIVSALQNNDYVTKIEAVLENGNEVGYTISFTKSEPITIYHGKDGKDGENGEDGADGSNGIDGYTPIIGVLQDNDGIYYWTLDGEWLTDDSGNKIKAQGIDGKDGVDGEDGKEGQPGSNGADGANGKDGADGITPQLKIENDYWYVSYDNGTTWKQLGRAVGNDGKDGANGSDGDSMFASIDSSNEEFVIFTLSNGTEIKLPTWYAFEALRTVCNQMNSNITALQTIVTALQNNDYVKSVTPVTENGIEIGYTITFTQSGAVTIYHGKDGQDGTDGKDGENGENGADGANGLDGHTPVIGVRTDSDGIYYWTLDGEWLTDDSGNKIKAQGIDGQPGENGADGQPGADGTNGADGKDGTDGITPQLRITEGYWEISYDNGDTWSQVGIATGEDGKDGDSMFQSVTYDDNNVYLVLTDNTTITIPKSTILSIEFDKESLIIMPTNTTRNINYVVNSSASNVTVAVSSSQDIKAKIIPEKESGHTGVLQITTGNSIDEYSNVIVFVSDDNKVIMQSISFEEAELKIYNTVQKTVPQEGGTITLDFLTNIEYDVIIPDDAQSWISIAPTVRSVAHEYITLQVSENNLTERSAVIKVQSKEDSLYIDFNVRQIASNSEPASNEIWYYTTDENIVTPYATDGFNASIVSNTYNNGLGVITFDGDVTTIGNNAFRGCNTLYAVKLPQSTNYIEEQAFMQCRSLSTITIPDNVTTIGAWAFYECSNIDNIIVGKNVSTFEGGAFGKCENLTTITFLNETYFNAPGLGGNPNLTTINSAFSTEDKRCLIIDNKLAGFAPAGLTEYTLPDGITTISGLNTNYLTTINFPESCTTINSMNGCLGLKDFTIPLSVTTIGKNAFGENDTIRNIVIPYTVTTIGDMAFQYCDNLTTAKIYSKTIGDWMFRYCENLSEVDLWNTTVIGFLAFASCNFATIDIPESVQTIKAGAFSGCRNLKEIYIHSIIPPEVVLYFNMWQAFYNIANDAVIYVPNESLELYKTTEYWSEYADLYVGYEYTE